MAHVITGAARRGARALRSVGPATVAVALALIIGAAGFADAATGGDFLLGRSNTDNSTSVLTDTSGVPLSLNAPSGMSPLSVNSTLQVNRLNAQYVGGEGVKQLQATGGLGITGVAVDIALPLDTYVSVASTGALQAGTYYVSASTLIDGAGGTVFCKIIGSSGVSVPVNWGGGTSTSWLQATENSVATVPANGVMTESCYGEGTSQFYYDAAITAMRISSSSMGTEPSIVPQHVLETPPSSIIGPPRGSRPERRFTPFVRRKGF